MIIIMIITFIALSQKAMMEFGNNNILFALSILLVCLILWMVFEGVIKVFEIKKRM